ncbi:thiamine phosphate synthase [Pontibacter flavimaris]|uniref:Thiamine phosphate synthase n=1 Tax=Pontibacter flavimaris TaxID=1797110 RepID=A0A1Q5PCA3_9BACT|nr:thiamine phosphate synthase [Pontibacter flavimaris]OKL39821.1 thiamine phosphate synthase [Pontibacter flavimaris]
MREHSKIKRGVYLVLDPGINRAVLLQKVKEALEGGVSALQVWNHWPAGYTEADKKALIKSLVDVAGALRVPVLINEAWELLQDTELSGVHFDDIPANFESIKNAVGREFITGITCSNNLDVVRWASQNHLDYVSFCAIFPSSSAGSCELVRPETIREARKMTQMPLFLSGGITTENLPLLKELDFDGVAVISGILNAASAKESAAAYHHALNKYKP